MSRALRAVLPGPNLTFEIRFSRAGSPEAGEATKETHMNKMIVVAALALASCLSPGWAASCPPAAVTSAAGSVTGSAHVCVDGDGVHVNVTVMNLSAGHAYTVWFGYVDKPLLCISPGCGGPDYVSPNPQVVVGRLASTVAGHNGEAHFSADIDSMLVSHGSEVQLVFFDHGMASTSDLRFRARQLLTPQDPSLGAPGLGVTADGAVGHFWGIAIVKFP
jgi:hypothetical protein